MPAPLLPLLLLAVAAPFSPQTAEPEPSEARLRKAWSFLLPEEKQDVADWFRLEVSNLDTFQGGLVRFTLEQSPIDPGFWPEDGPLPFYDPEVHAPGLPIKRKPLRPDDRKAVRVRREFLGEPDPRRLRSGWRYDWGTGELRRAGPLEDPERIFENGLQGYAPDLDLARALALQALDDGEQRTALGAFAHAYTDRAGVVYPGVTLYDAWNSGQRIEMPDVDALGIIHDVLDDWRKWKSPVPAKKQEALYARIGELYLEARPYRVLREALADTFLVGEPPLLDHRPNIGRFHALWEKHASTPASLAKELPSAKEWERYLEKLVKTLGREEDLWARGQNRQRVLMANERLVRGTLARVLREYGALDRKRLPKPAPKKKGQEKDGKR